MSTQTRFPSSSEFEPTDQAGTSPRAARSRAWFSPAGFRRGLILASLVAAAWAGWAVGYLQSGVGLPPVDGGGVVQEMPTEHQAPLHHHDHHPQASAPAV